MAERSSLEGEGPYANIVRANTTISHPVHQTAFNSNGSRRSSAGSASSDGRRRRASFAGSAHHRHGSEAGESSAAGARNSGAIDEKERHRDPSLDINLPYRTLSAGANFDEYVVEVPGGEIPGPVEPPDVASLSRRATRVATRVATRASSAAGGGAPPADIAEASGEESEEGADAQPRRYRLVTFEPGDKANPKNWSKAMKWYCTLVVALTCFVVAFASSVITADISGVAEEFDVSEEVVLLTITLFVVGFGVGPLVFAPLSEVYGRRVI